MAVNESMVSSEQLVDCNSTEVRKREKMSSASFVLFSYGNFSEEDVELNHMTIPERLRK